MPRLISILMLALMVSACQNDASDHLPSSSDQTKYNVSIANIEERELPVIYPVSGTIIAKNQLQLASRMTGYIEHIEVDEGDLVEPGVVLVRIDGAQVEAAIRSAEAALVSVQAELEDAKDDLMRYRVLLKTQVLAEDKLRDAVVRQTKAAAALEQAQAELTAKQQERQYIHLTSPVRAQVRERLSDQGDLALAGNPILRLDVLNALELAVYVPFSQIEHVTQGQKIDIFVQSNSQPIIGEVIRIIHSADRVTRSHKVRIALPDNNHLFPGQFARAHILLGQQAAPVVPISAIVERAGIEGVFVVEGTDTARFRSIRTGKVWQDYNEVLAGVEAGLSVVINPPSALRDGDLIKGQL